VAPEGGDDFCVHAGGALRMPRRTECVMRAINTLPRMP
jgi:hypothetical protein